MPIYNFLCEECNKKFEKIMNIEDGEKVSKVKMNCPFCENLRCIKKIPSVYNFVVKGYNAKNGYSKK